MWRFIVRRLTFIPIIGIIISAFVFVMLRAFPQITGDPAVNICGMNCSPERLDIIRHELGLDRPIIVQYGEWMGDVLTGNMCTNY